MIVTELMTATADAAAQRYGMLVDALRFIYSQTINSRDFGSARSLNEASIQAYGAAASYIEKEEEESEAETDRFSEFARNATLERLELADSEAISGALNDHLNASDDYLQSEISVQVERDIAFLRKSLVTANLHISIAAGAHSMPREAAMIQYRISNPTDLRFFFYDRRSQRSPSRRHIQLIWRQHLVAVYNETVLMTLAEFGQDRAVVRHPDPASPHNGLVLALAAGAGVPTYAQIRGEIFHPNSNALLELP